MNESHGDNAHGSIDLSIVAVPWRFSNAFWKEQIVSKDCLGIKMLKRECIKRERLIGYDLAFTILLAIDRRRHSL